MIHILIRIILTPISLLADSLLLICWFTLAAGLGQLRWDKTYITEELWRKPLFKNQ